MLVHLAFAVQVLLMLGTPAVIALLLRWRWGLPWKLFWVGCLTFIGSRVVHIPLFVVEKEILKAIEPTMPFPVLALVDALLVGLLAAACEEPARYLGYRFLLRRERRWQESLMFGAGHGGVESVILGIVVLVNVVVLAWLASADLASLGIVGSAAEQVRQQIHAVQTAPLHLPVLGGLERLWVICFHLGLTVLVWRTVTARRWRYLLAAIGCHWLANTGTVLVLVGTANALVIEAVLTAVGLLSLGFVWWSQRWSSEEASPDMGSMGEEQAPA